MKLGTISGVFRYLAPVREKQEGNSGEKRQNDDSQQKRKDQSEKEFDPKEFDQAVEAFQSASQGLTAAVSGQGPGLKVTLMDGTGAVVRQMTGEEFMRLHEIAGEDKSARGKILDQKL